MVPAEARRSCSYNRVVDISKDVGDRQLDALLDRLDRIAAELERLNRRAEQQEGFALVARELRELNESLNALAYAALGQTPRVRRRAG